jgi:CRP-like cAMP-binding protein
MDAHRLEDVPLFSKLSHKQRKAVSQHADEVSLGAGAHIIDEGHLAYELFVIESGTADVSEGGNIVAQVGPGDVVGEIGVLKTHKRTASVVATSPVEVIVIYGPELTAMKETVPEVFAELERLVTERTSRS